jgi:invasion protein IalB
MKSIIAALCLAFAASSVAVAAEKKAPSPKQQAQQQRMKDCNKQAGEKKLKGDARKKFMSGCLKG